MENTGQELSWKEMLVFFLCIGIFIGSLIYGAITSANTPYEKVRIVDKYQKHEIFDNYYIKLSNNAIFDVGIHEWSRYSIGDYVMYHPYTKTIRNNR